MVSEKTLNSMGLLSMAFGGFLILTYVAMAYMAVWRGEFFPGFPGGPRRMPQDNPVALLLSPFFLLVLLCGLAFLANGYVLLRHVRHSEVRRTRFETLSVALTEDENEAVQALESVANGLTQKELSVRLGFSAVRIHRVLARLEQKGLVKLFPFGMTNKVVLQLPEEK